MREGGRAAEAAAAGGGRRRLPQLISIERMSTWASASSSTVSSSNGFSPRNLSSARPAVVEREGGERRSGDAEEDRAQLERLLASSTNIDENPHLRRLRTGLLRKIEGPRRRADLLPWPSPLSPSHMDPDEKSPSASEESSLSDATDDDTPALAVAVSKDSSNRREMLHYSGNAAFPITSTANLVKPGEDTPGGVWPVFRMMDENGRFRENETSVTPDPLSSLDAAATTEATQDDLAALKAKLAQAHPLYAGEFQQNPLLQESEPDSHHHHHEDDDAEATMAPPLNTLMRAYRHMVRMREMDTILQNAQRQGRISFYLTCTGEEAILFGAASALHREDTVFAQYREAALLMWRGFTLEQFCDQCFSNAEDLGKGRQMPVHYGSRALHFQTVSSTLGTQLPQAVGAAYRLKIEAKPNVAICFFGDGCASTSDFHSALNFAATLKSPVLFLCRNNGYAISTPVEEQYASDGIVSRAPGYGMAGIRVDGNDIFAVSAAVREARAYALENSAPVLIEAITYRQGHHSTSDDSTRYRNADDVLRMESSADPMVRLEALLGHIGWMDDSTAAAIRKEERSAVLEAMRAAERKPKPALETLFQDVYFEKPPHLMEQEASLKEHITKYPDKY